METEARGQRHRGDGHAAQAVRVVTAFAEEVSVQVVPLLVALLPAVAVRCAEGVLGLPRAVVDGMDQVMPQEEGKRAEDGGLVHGDQSVLQVGQGQGAGRVLHGAVDEHPQGGGPDAAAEEKILLAEYALDFALQGANRALLLAMEAIDAQYTGQEGDRQSL